MPLSFLERFLERLNVMLCSHPGMRYIPQQNITTAYVFCPDCPLSQYVELARYRFHRQLL